MSLRYKVIELQKQIESMPSVDYSDTRLERWMWQECRDNSLEDLQLTAASAQMSKSKEEKIDSKAIKVEVAELGKCSERKDIIGLGDNMESSRDDMRSRPTFLADMCGQL